MRKIFNKKGIAALLLAMAMMFTTLAPSYTAIAARALDDNIDFGEPSFDAVTNVMKYNKAIGQGSGTYKSIVVSFTSIRENNEKIILPTGVDGFNYASDISTDATYIINMPGGKTLEQVASYIRKMQFVNCEKSSQEINFSVGKDIVKYMTFYSKDTGHYYQYIKFTPDLYEASIKDLKGNTISYGNWDYAYFKALSLQYEGLQGYLASVSSIQEDAFLYKTSNEIGWLSGTRLLPGDKTTVNGIPAYKSFTTNTVAADNGTGYWYWSAGPELNNASSGKFYDYKMTDSAKTYYEKTNAKGWYINWKNSGEPNNSTNETVVTTLKIGSGYKTSSVPSSSPYYIADGYSWNDMTYTNWAWYAPYNQEVTNYGIKTKVTDYTPTGFFVEYGDQVTGLSDTAKKALTNFEASTKTQVHTHTWEYGKQESDTVGINDTAIAYCTNPVSPTCSYYGTAAIHTTVVEATLNTPDMATDGTKAYNLATISGESGFLSLTKGTKQPIKYYKTAKRNAVSGGDLVDGAPKIPGYYYASVTISNSGSSTTIVSPFMLYDPDAKYAVEEKNNKIVDEKGNVIDKANLTYTAITDKSKTPTTNLEVVLAAPTDTVKLYKIGNMTWKGDVLSDMAWADDVQAWINANETYKASARTPATLSGTAANTAAWASFYKALLKDEGKLETAKLNALEATARDSGSGIESYTSVSETYRDAKGDPCELKVDGAYTYSYKYTNIDVGLYAVIANDGGSYAVTVAAIYPQRTGPESTYTIQNLFTVYIKETQASLDKHINNLEEDTIAIGDKVEFEIDMDLPSYKDRVKNGAISTPSGYTLKFIDTMSPAYTIDPKSVKLYATYTTGAGKDAVYHEDLIYNIDSEDTTHNTIPTHNNYIFYETSQSGAVVVDAGNRGGFGLTGTELDGKYALQRTDTPIFDAITVTKDTSEGHTVGDKITINFDEPALRAYTKEMVATKGASVSYRLVYNATVNPNVKVASKDNINTAAIKYENDASGNDLKDLEDPVYGYTFALDVIKLNGTKTTDVERVPLAGAKFVLYKETATFIDDVFAGDIKGSENNPYLNETDDTDAKTLTTIGKSKDFYVVEETAAAAGSTVALTKAPGDKADTKVTYAKDQKVTRVFEKVVIPYGSIANAPMAADGTITSVNDLRGVNVYGLNVGNYILVETKAPVGFNELAEDIYFEINPLTDEELTDKTFDKSVFREMFADEASRTAYMKSLPELGVSPTPEELAAFELAKTTRYNAATYNTTGTITLDVLNYQGLTLPSTGGIGIIIFIILGVTIMGSVIAILVVRRKKEADEL